MIHSRRKSILLNRIEWLIKGYKSWLKSCTDLIMLGEKLAMSSWTIFLFVSGSELLLNYYLMIILVSKSCFDQGEQWEKGTEKVPKVLTGRDANKHNMPIAAFLILDWNSAAMACTQHKHLKLWRTAIFSSSSTSTTLWMDKEWLKIVTYNYKLKLCPNPVCNKSFFI